MPKGKGSNSGNQGQSSGQQNQPRQPQNQQQQPPRQGRPQQQQNQQQVQQPQRQNTTSTTSTIYHTRNANPFDLPQMIPGQTNDARFPSNVKLKLNRLRSVITDQGSSQQTQSTPAQKLQRGALLADTLNFGFNIGNRQPSYDLENPDKESGQRVAVQTEVRQYARSVATHPTVTGVEYVLEALHKLYQATPAGDDKNHVGNAIKIGEAWMISKPNQKHTIWVRGQRMLDTNRCPELLLGAEAIAKFNSELEACKKLNNTAFQDYLKKMQDQLDLINRSEHQRNHPIPDALHKDIFKVYSDSITSKISLTPLQQTALNNAIKAIAYDPYNQLNRDLRHVGAWVTPEEIVGKMLSELSDVQMTYVEKHAATLCYNETLYLEKEAVTSTGVSSANPVINLNALNLGDIRGQNEKITKIESNSSILRSNRLVNSRNTTLKVIMSNRAQINRWSDDSSQVPQGAMTKTINGSVTRQTYPNSSPHVQSFIVTFGIPKSQYPCVISAFHQMFDKLGLNAPHKEKKRDAVVKFLIAYFAALLNYHSLRYYGKDYIWTQCQSSYGSLRPSIAETGSSFRFSLGVVPANFHFVFDDALKDFQKIIDNIGIITNDSNLNMLEKTFGKGEIETCHNVFFNKLVACAANNTTVDQAFFTGTISWLDTYNNKNPREKDGERINQKELLSSNITRMKAAVGNDAPIKAVPSLELQKTLKDLIYLCKEKTTQVSADTQLKELSKTLGEYIAEIEAGTPPNYQRDYSACVTAIENLSRVYHLYLMREGIVNASQLTTENVAALSASSSSSSQPVLQEDDALTNVELADLSLITVQTRNGMSALRHAFDAVDNANSVGSGRYINHSVTGDIYFEVRPAIAQERKNWGHRQLNQNPIYVHFTDSAVFTEASANNQVLDTWVDSTKTWKKINDDTPAGNRFKLPDILVIDVTSCSNDELIRIVDNFKSLQPRQKPYALILNSSENKTGQIVDITSMGEARLLTRPNVELSSNLTHLTQNDIDNMKAKFGNVKPEEKPSYAAQKALELNNTLGIRSRTRLKLKNN